MEMAEVMDCQDLVDDLNVIAHAVREDYCDWAADDLEKAADKLANLVERLRVS